MLRTLYILALRAHPAPFRQRFGDEMLDIFDQAASRRESWRLLADGIRSLLRQWTLRSEFRRPPLEDAPAAAGDGLVFELVDTRGPRPAAIVEGGFLALLALCAMVALIGVGGRARAFLIGAADSRPGLLPMARPAAAGAGVDTAVVIGRRPEHPLSAIARPYFRIVRVLQAIDDNGDLTLSPWEIVIAPRALRRLDADHDQALSPEECGWRGGSATAAFMLGNPALAALDANHDNRISAGEIAAAPSALRQLDRNTDGFLTPDELLPDDESLEIATVLMGMDATASPEERDRAVAQIRRRHEASRELDRARRKAGIR